MFHIFKLAQYSKHVFSWIRLIEKMNKFQYENGQFGGLSRNVKKWIQKMNFKTESHAIVTFWPYSFSCFGFFGIFSSIKIKMVKNKHFCQFFTSFVSFILFRLKNIKKTLFYVGCFHTSKSIIVKKSFNVF